MTGNCIFRGPYKTIAIWILALSIGGAAVAGDRVLVRMKNGDQIQGELLRRDDNLVHVLVGGALVSVDAREVERISSHLKAGTDDLERVQKHGLYSTARHPKRDMPILVEELGPAIAVVKTPAGLGTGWFCNRQGHLVTNHHVVAGERDIRVTVFPRQGKTLGRKVYRQVRIVALNAEMDLALLKVEEPLGVELPVLSLSDSEAPKVGDKAFAIGNPLGLERSTSQGIVSKVGRNIGGRLFIQTTAPIAPGNSGGPLFNERGEVIGVVSRGAILLDGLGFAIPAAYVREFLDNVEAFAYDEDNPNTGIEYMQAPVSSSDGKVRFTSADFVRVGRGLCCLELADLNGDGVDEILFADNNKSELVVLTKRRGKVSEATLNDEWDINQLPESKYFAKKTFPVSSRVSSIAVGEVTGDRHLDVVFFGQPGGLSVLAGQGKGEFDAVRRIADVEAAGVDGALRVADLDRDGKPDIFVLGRDVFTVFWGGEKRQEYVLDPALRSKVKEVQIVDLDGDSKRRLDLMFFVGSGNYGVHLLLQGQARQFHQDQPLRSQINGPVRFFAQGSKPQFVTLDPGINRVRRLRLRSSAGQRISKPFEHAYLSVPVSVGVGDSAQVDLLDVDGDGKQELLAVDQRRSEFVFIEHEGGKFIAQRSPSPVGILAARLFKTPSDQAVAFSYSKADKLLGVSRLEKGKLSFPQPLQTPGVVQWMQLERLRGLAAGDREQAYLIWVEKSASGQTVHLAPAAELAAAAFDGKSGSIDLQSATLTFGADEKGQRPALAGKVKNLAFADFNGDRLLDLVVFWAYSGKESLYLGLGGRRFVEVSKRQGLVDDTGKQSLLVEDLDGDGVGEVLQVQPGFVRVLRVDERRRLFVEKQINWAHGAIERLAAYDQLGGRARLVVVNGNRADVVRLEQRGDAFEILGTVDLTGVQMDDLAVGDLDGDRRPDLVGWSGGAVHALLNRKADRLLQSDSVLNASLSHFLYWNLATGDLDRDGRDEVLLFDKLKSVIEILRVGKAGQLQPVLRHRLFNSQLNKMRKTAEGGKEQPAEVGIGDVDGNGRPDLIFILQDRVAIYLQARK